MPEELHGMPPRPLRLDIMLSEEAPTLARIQIKADDGMHGFLVQRDTLEEIANLCLKTAAEMPKTEDLS